MALSEPIVSRYCLIRDRRIIVNGAIQIEEEQGADFGSFLSSVYKTFGSEYPKFFKMDPLSKLGVLTADFLLESGKRLRPYQSEEIAIIAANTHSSLETDDRYYRTIEDQANYYPNPALFVYTLPNLLIGEISIKFAIKGESVFFISRQPDFKWLHTYSDILLETPGTKTVIVGWVDLDVNRNYESILFLVENQDPKKGYKGTWPFTPEAMEHLYFEKNLEEEG